MWKKNMGTADRIFRSIVALVVVVLIAAKVVTGVWAIVLGVLAAIFLLTSIVSFCPLYYPFGFRTRPAEKS